MQGSRLDFMKRKKKRSAQQRESGRKGRTAARGAEKSMRGRRKSDGEGGVDVGWNNLTRGCLLAHRYATNGVVNVSTAVCRLDNAAQSEDLNSP